MIRPMQRLAFLVVMLSWTAPTSAQEATPEMLDAEARARFELAMVHIDNGRFEEAAGEFHQAYELSGRDGLLYNEFLAWRDGGFFERAVVALTSYLETVPEDDENRPNLEARLRALQARLASAGDGEREDTTAPTPAEEDSPSENAAPEAPRTSPHPVGYALIGVGAAIAIAGAIVGGVALSLSDELAGACAGGVCPEDRRGDLDTGPALALSADVLLPVGAVTAVVGLILLFTVTEEEAAPSAAVACDGSGCFGALGGTF